MSAPLINATTLKVKEGELEDLKRYYEKVAEFIEANEPQLIAFHGFLNEDGTELTSIQVHPDTVSMEFHMQLLRDSWEEHFSEYGEMFDVVSVEYYGTPPESALEMDRQGGFKSDVKPVHIAGFTRSPGG